MPLAGVCPTCGTALTMTVHEASVVKYLDVTKKLAKQHDVDAYTSQRVELTERNIDSLFTNDHAKQSSLLSFDDASGDKDEEKDKKKKKGRRKGKDND
jgi:DNA polymerase II large subunit